MKRDALVNTLLVALLWVATLVLSGCNRPDPVDPVEPKGTGKLTFIVIDNLVSRTPENSALITNNQYWQGVKADGHEYKLLDAFNPATLDFVGHLTKKQIEVDLPALYVVSHKTGKIVVAEKLTDSKRVDEILAKWSKKKARGPPSYIDETGQPRKLGLIPPDAEALKKRAKMQSFTDGLKGRGAVLIPRDKWRDIEYPQFARPEYVLNQFNSSGCVGYSEAAAHGKLRDIRGMKYERLSGSFTYAHINGGQDGGAMILDALESAAKYGHALETEFNYPKLFLGQIPSGVKQTALNRQSTLAYPIDTEEEMATALQLGMVVQAGVCVDGNFERFDSNGISSARGGYANHSIHIDGMKQIDGKWRYHMGNTWGATWGPFRNGSCYLNAAGVILQGDAFVHADSKWQADELPILKSINLAKKGSDHAFDARFILAQ